MKKRISAVAASVMLMLFASFAVACSKDTPSGNPDEPIDIKYSVTFAYNYDAAPNGGIYKTDAVVSGHTVAKPIDPTRDGFAFSAWTVATAESSARFDFTTAISADTTVYAQWQTTGGTTEPDVPDPTEPTDPDEPPVTQKELTGIEIKTLPTKLTYTVGDTFDVTGLQVSAVYDNGDKEDIVADEYNVSSPDMSRSGTVTVTVTYKADISKTATFDITVNAPQQELPKHKIDFDINGGDKSVFPIVNIEDGTTVNNVPVTSKFGYTFDGWYYNDVLFDLANTPITQDYLLVAHFTPVSYALAYGTGEHGSVQTSDIRFTVENYGDITLPEVTVTTGGYYFIGWFDAATGGNEVTEITEAMVRAIGADNTLTVYARYSNEYTVQFDTDGGEPRPAAQKVEYLSSASKPTIDPTKSGLTFVGWTLDGEPYDFASPVKGDITLVAQWTDKNKYTVKFLNGSSVLREISVEEGSKIASYVPELKGYDFGGWYKDSALLTVFDFDELISSNTNIFAKLTETEYTITYILNDGINDAANPDKYTVSDGTVTLKDATKYGFAFVGWFTAGEGGDKKSSLSIDDFDGTEIKLYAIFEAIEYTVTFDANGGVLAADTEGEVLVGHGNTVARPADPVRENYEFVGWTVNDVAYDFDSVITSDITIKAQWTVKIYVAGIYSGDTLISELLANEADDKELIANNVTLKVGVAVRFRTASDWSRISVKSGVGSAKDMFTVNGDTITLENDADGDTFNFYLDTSVTSGDNLWIACVGKRIESQLTDGDGIYSDSDLLAPFVNNDNGFNEVMTIIDIELAEKTVLTVRYGGAIDADATLNPACTLGSAANGKFTLPAGTYSFYYNYYTKVMWISGTPDVSQDPNAGFAYDAVTDTLKVYLTGQFAAKDMESFDWDNGYVFATTDNNCYKLDRIYLQEGDIIKVRSGSIGYGYNYIKAKYGEPVQTGGVKDGGGNDRNIIIVNTGYYSIEFWKEYSGDKLISILYSVD